MVHAMEPPEQARVMHQPMRPVEVGVVEQDRGRDGRPEPQRPMRVELPVKPRPTLLRQPQRARAHSPVNDDGEQRPAELAPDVGAGGVSRDDLPGGPTTTKQHVAEQPSEAGPEGIVEQALQGDAPDRAARAGQQGRQDFGGEHAGETPIAIERRGHPKT